MSDTQLTLMICAGVVTGVVLVGGILLALRIHEKRRREALRGVADLLGMTFDPDATGVLESPFAQLPLFERGHSRRARNLLHRDDGNADARVFDYRYTVGGGKHQSIHQQTVVAVPMSGCELPAFELRPENVFHKIGAAFGYQDIDFPNYPDFSSQYLVRGPDEASVRELFSDRCIRALQNAESASSAEFVGEFWLG